jgi:hypothetical protein
MKLFFTIELSVLLLTLLAGSYAMDFNEDFEDRSTDDSEEVAEDNTVNLKSKKHSTFFKFVQNLKHILTKKYQRFSSAS